MAAAAHSLQKITAILDSASAAAGTRLALEQALADKHLFFFADLYAHPAVGRLSGTSEAGWARVLEIFAFHTLQTLKAESTKLPSLSAKQLWKLKQLSLMSMAASTARLAYVEMMSCLDLATSEEVESLVISCIDAGLLDAKMNQTSQLVEVRSVRGRDLAAGDVAEALARLDSWQVSIQRAMAALHGEAAAASASFKSSVANAAAMSARVGEAVVLAAGEGKTPGEPAGGRGGGRHSGGDGGGGGRGGGGFVGALTSIMGFGGDPRDPASSTSHRGGRRM